MIKSYLLDVGHVIRSVTSQVNIKGEFRAPGPNKHTSV